MDRDDRGVRARWPQYVVIGLAFVAVVGSFWYRGATARDADQVVIRLERDGGRVHRDEELIARLAGPQRVDREAAIAAYCVNGWYWATDDTLDLDVVVGTGDRLIEAAELVASGRHDAELVSVVENADLSSEIAPLIDVTQVPDRIVARFGESAVSEYLADVSQPPAQESRDRFLVFAASITTSRQSVFVIDLDNLDTDAIRRFMGQRGFGVTGNDVVVAGSERTFFVDESDCASLIAD